jgi:hypothetical protein
MISYKQNLKYGLIWKIPPKKGAQKEEFILAFFPVVASIPNLSTSLFRVQRYGIYFLFAKKCIFLAMLKNCFKSTRIYTDKR